MEEDKKWVDICRGRQRTNLHITVSVELTHGPLVGPVVKGATPGPRKQTSAGQGLKNISVITETGERWEGRCAVVSCSAK